MSVYLDHNATTPLDERVFDAMRPWLTGVHGNPASVHRYGRAARAALDEARARVAALVNARSNQVIFTGGGTEADNLALKGVCHGSPGRLLVSAVEHAAVQAPTDALAADGWNVQRIPVDGEGRIRFDALADLLMPPTRLVSVMLANNETGVMEDVTRVAELAHARSAWAHTDAVQAAGKMPVDFTALGVDLMTLSAHKLGGPRGVGALVFERRVPLMPLAHGGGQEQGLRGGTENLAGIVGFGKAAELAGLEWQARAQHARLLRDRLEQGLNALPGIRIFSKAAERLPNTVQFALAGLDGEWLVMELDKRGFAVSSGSACHSGSGKPSQVLTAMGVEPAVARGAVRVSFGAGNSQDDVDALLKALVNIVDATRHNARAAAW